METRDIVRMANQIADYFKIYPEEEGIREVANHIHNFWEPRMRRALADHIAAGGAGLSPLVLKAAGSQSLAA